MTPSPPRCWNLSNRFAPGLTCIVIAPSNLIATMGGEAQAIAWLSVTLRGGPKPCSQTSTSDWGSLMATVHCCGKSVLPRTTRFNVVRASFSIAAPLDFRTRKLEKNAVAEVAKEGQAIDQVVGSREQPDNRGKALRPVLHIGRGHRDADSAPSPQFEFRRKQASHFLHRRTLNFQVTSFDDRSVVPPSPQSSGWFSVGEKPGHLP